MALKAPSLSHRWTPRVLLHCKPVTIASQSASPSALCMESVFFGKTVDYLASSYCGEFGSQNCTWLLLTNSNGTLYSLSACSNSTYCSPSCLAAITAAEKHGGCCYAQYLNGPKALCGQQPIAPCSTTVSRGSEGIGFNILLILFMVAVQRAIYWWVMLSLYI